MFDKRTTMWEDVCMKGGIPQGLPGDPRLACFMLIIKSGRRSLYYKEDIEYEHREVAICNADI